MSPLSQIGERLSHTRGPASSPKNYYDTPTGSLDNVEYAAQPLEPATSEDVVSPFLATLGSVLLDADSIQNCPDFQLHTTLIEPLEDPEQASYSPHALRVDHQIKLSGAEISIFQNYVDNVSLWVDAPNSLSGV